MKKLVITISILLVVTSAILALNWKREQRSIQEAYAHLMHSPLSTGLTPVTEPESGALYYSAKYRASRQGGYEVFDIGNLRLVRTGYSDFSPGGASGSVVLPAGKKLSGLDSIYADRIKIFGSVFRIEGDELLIGDARLKMTSPKPQRLKVDSDWNPDTSA